MSPPDHKAVAAIEKLIGQKIAAMAAPVGGAERQQRRAEPVRAFEKSQVEPRAASAPQHRRRHAPAKVTRLDEARPARPQHRAEPDGSAHLPAFLLRPIRAKA